MKTSIAIAIAALTSTASAAFTTCSAWGAECFGSVRPNTCVGLAPLCYNPSASVVCAACRCLDGALKGTLQGGSVQIGVADSICQQFFATNSTPTAIEKGPVLGGTTTTTASSTQHTKAASSGFLASTSVGAAMLSALFLF